MIFMLFLGAVMIAMVLGVFVTIALITRHYIVKACRREAHSILENPAGAEPKKIDACIKVLSTMGDDGARELTRQLMRVQTELGYI